MLEVDVHTVCWRACNWRSDCASRVTAFRFVQAPCHDRFRQPKGHCPCCHYKFSRFRMSNSGQQPPASAFRALLAGAAISAAVSVAAAGVSAARRRCVNATSKFRSRQPSRHNFPASVFCRMFSMLSQYNTDWTHAGRADWCDHRFRGRFGRRCLMPRAASQTLRSSSGGRNRCMPSMPACAFMTVLCRIQRRRRDSESCDSAVTQQCMQFSRSSVAGRRACHPGERVALPAAAVPCRKLCRRAAAAALGAR